MPVPFVVVLDKEKREGRVGEPKIVVVDYHKGNLSSVVRGLARAGAAACTSDDPEQISRADGLVIPGVGAFYDAIAFMRRSGEEAAVLDAVAACSASAWAFSCFLSAATRAFLRARVLPRAATPPGRPVLLGSMAWASCAVRARAWSRVA